MSKYTTKQIVDMIRKGDPLSHKMLRVIADRLEVQQREHAHRTALVTTLKVENTKLMGVLEEIVSTAESDPENQHAMNSYSAGYSGGLEEQAQRAREVLLEKDSHTQPNY